MKQIASSPASLHLNRFINHCLHLWDNIKNNHFVVDGLMDLSLEIITFSKSQFCLDLAWSVYQTVPEIVGMFYSRVSWVVREKE